MADENGQCARSFRTSAALRAGQKQHRRGLIKMHYPIENICHYCLETPAAVAIIDHENTFSYAELLSGALRIAQHLEDAGVKPGCRVALFMEKNSRWFMSMLAVQLCGAAYVPLDTAYPAQRIAYCIDDCQAMLTLSDEKQGETLAGNKLIIANDTDYSCLDDLDSRLRRYLAVPRNGEMPAYIIYTSGSTGQPKGVVVSWRALAFHMAWMNKEFDWQPQDRFIQKSSISFDASVWEYFAPLMRGASFVISGSDPLEIVQNIKQYQVTVAQFVPTVLSFLAETEQLVQMTSLRLLFSGGEALEKQLADTFINALAVPVINLYGPTETTIQCCRYPYVKTQSTSQPYIPIGQVIPGVRYKIQPLDEATPALGELIIFGDNIASGYYNQPELTKERFVFDADGKICGYRTGDIVEQLPDGNLMFAGRRDRQIKLRGLRIELGEITEAIQRVAKDASNVHVAVQDDEHLVAWLEGGADYLVADLHSQLAELLPTYMIPSRFISIERFPSLPNDKLDVGQLEKMLTDVRPTGTSRLLTPQEQQISDIWCNVAGRRLAADENLFQQGMTSLQLVYAAALLGNAFAVKIAGHTLANYDSISKQALMLNGLAPEKHQTQQPAALSERIPLSYGQQGILFSCLADEKCYTYNLAYTLDAGVATLPALQAALTAACSHFPALRSLLVREENAYYQRVLPIEANRPIDIERHTDDSPQNREEFARRSFNLFDAPAIRVGQFGSQPSRLLFIFHHLFFDGYSATVLFTFIERYLHQKTKSIEQDEAFTNYCLAQAQYEQRDSHDMGWWRQQLAAVPTESRVAKHYLKSPYLTERGDVIALQADPDLQQQIDRLSQTLGTTAFPLLFISAAHTLGHFTEKNTLCIGVPVLNRDSLDELHSVGNYVNVLPIPYTCQEQTLAEAVTAFSTQFNQCLAHGKLPVEKIINQIATGKASGGRPLFQNMFVCNDFTERSGDFRWHYHSVKAAKADLSFIVDYRDSGLSLSLEFCCDVVSQMLADEIMQHWLKTLKQLLSEGQLHAECTVSSQPVPATNPASTTGQAYLAKVMQTFGRYMGGAITADNDFFLHGGHSLLAIRILNDLGKHYAVTLPSYLIFEDRTPRNIAASVERLLSPRNEQPVKGVTRLAGKSTPDQHHVWFIHPAGGALWCYKDMADRLDKLQVSSSGIECVPAPDQERFENNLLAMAERYASYILASDPRDTLSLVGYSFGGNVAYEVARLLQYKYDKRCNLILLDSHICSEKPYQLADFISSYALKFTEGNPNKLDRERLYLANGEVDFNYLQQLGVSCKHISAQTPADEIAAGLNMWVANNQAVHTHNPIGSFSGKTLFIRASKNPVDSRLNWEKHLPDYQSVIVEAGHFDIYKAPATENVANAIAAFLQLQGE
ncbi:TPA: non-ribosomal peptide synthetase [Serratia fonticola]|uniref:non-ribosomal peptide synthetase n=1 Tax=Serratia fonticola TaxID=47917 RepID=UPI00192AF494|nr:non-ribosomal peptide synthetase [Serratia fonticola]MBL5903887.1 amino acid adenylation domain-containing protein [Serratia fonticola]